MLFQLPGYCALATGACAALNDFSRADDINTAPLYRFDARMEPSFCHDAF